MDGGDEAVMNHIMLRFRPIAPKPTVMNGSDSSYSSDLGNNREVLPKKRSKRKYVRVDKSVKKNNISVVETKSSVDEEAGVSDLRAAKSWVTLECVTGGSGSGHGRSWLGCTDMEKVSSLERDTCPGFVSDGDGCVRWVNLAYKRMVGSGEGVVVWLLGKEKIPVGEEAFSCRVRVGCGGGGGKGKVVPCDVWKMDGQLGRYAWRLDLVAALTLGPLNYSLPSL